MRDSQDGPVRLVQKILLQYPNLSGSVTNAIASIPRDAFSRGLPPHDISHAYEDLTIQIPGSGGYFAPLSQPSVVALMLDALAVEPGNRVLEVGAGSGYAAALLSELAGDDALVTTLEVDPVLAKTAADNLQFVGKPGVNVREANASACPSELEGAQFDRVLLSASTRVPPEWIIRSLSSGGIVVFPLDMLVTRPGWPCFLAKLQRKADALLGNLVASSVQGWESLRQAPDRPETDGPAPVEWGATETWEMLQSVEPSLVVGGPEGYLIYLLGKIEAAFQSGKVYSCADCLSWFDDARCQELRGQWLQEGSPGPESFALHMTDRPGSEQYDDRQVMWLRGSGEHIVRLLL